MVIQAYKKRKDNGLLFFHGIVLLNVMLVNSTGVQVVIQIEHDLVFERVIFSGLPRDDDVKVDV
jgi:hypothetical protein